jgi:hypothetical protein
MHSVPRRPLCSFGVATFPVGLVEQILSAPGVRPGIVDTAQRRLSLGPLPTSHLLAASVVEVLVAGRRG